MFGSEFLYLWVFFVRFLVGVWQGPRSPLPTVKYKSTITQKQRIAQKKSIIQKLRSEQCGSLIFLKNKLLKVTSSQKLRIAQKISFMQKMSARSILIYPANLVTFAESYICRHPKRPFWTAGDA